MPKPLIAVWNCSSRPSYATDCEGGTAKGFEMTQKSNGVGLTNIYTRADLILARYYHSQPGRGTTVAIVAPL